jgi:hypothetical protein
MAFQVERSMKDAEDIDVPIRAALVDDSVAAVQQDSDTRILLGLVEMSDVREGEREVGPSRRCRAPPCTLRSDCRG